MKKALLSMSATLFYVAVAYLAATPVYAIDWQTVPGKTITLFYPGQTNWEWLLTEHEGAPKIKSGKFCRECHDDIQKEMGEKLIVGGELEANPITGKPGSIEVEVKTAYDADRLYLHLSWKSPVSANVKEYPDFEAMASVMLDDGKIPEIARGGCWGACHADVNTMPSADSANNISKYLVKSRSKMTRKGGGNNIKSPDQLQSLLDSDYFAEIWQSRLNKGQLADVIDGYILESRHNHPNTQVKAHAENHDGVWTVEMSRPLTVSSPGYKSITPDKTYTLGFAIHDGYVQGRRHYVSLAYTLRLDDGPADFIAHRQ